MVTTFSWQRWIASCFSQRSLSTAVRSRQRLRRDRAAASLEPLEARTLLTFGAVFELSSLTGANGFQISGEATEDRSGNSVSDAGDINGDGIDDLIIGANDADPHGNSSGASYVVFGSRTPFEANLNLSSLTGANGFQISGEAGSDFSGRSVSDAGDINGDGIDDLIVGAPYAGVSVYDYNTGEYSGRYRGASYVVFGSRAPFSANLNLSALDGSNGFKISGEADYDRSGTSVSAAGDINGDGIDDLIAGAPYADRNGPLSGASYVVFGSRTAFAANLELAALDGSNGFQISGDRSGGSVSGAGDINGDGIDDLIIGARLASPNGNYSGASYVVFGSRTAFAATLNLSSLTGANGFQISGEAVFDQSGFSVSGAGDINGDGIDDLIIGARSASSNGPLTGASYVVFGSRTAFAANLNLSSLTGANGFQIRGEAVFDFSGSSVNGAGDINGDGIDDLIVGAILASPNGSRSGASYVVFGGNPQAPNAAPVVTDLTDSTDEDNTFSGNVTATDDDAGDTSFTFSIVGATPAGVTFNSDGSFTVAPQLADQALAVTESRLVQFDYKANDGKDDSNTATVRITINGRNDDPTLANEIADQVATETVLFSFTFAEETFDDIDANDVLTYSATQSDSSDLPTWLTFDPDTRTFSGTPTNTDVGRLSITVTAMDSHEASASATFDLAVLGTAITQSNGVVTITDIGGASNDAIEITIDGDNLVVTLEGGTTRIPLAGLTELIINGGGGDDTLTVDLGGGPLPFNITFHGGVGGHDSLIVTGFDESGAFNAYNANFTNRHDGNIQFRDEDGILSTLTYTGLEPITIDGTPTEVVFNLPNSFNSDVTLSDIGGANGVMRLAGSTFEATDFSVGAMTSIIINGNVGNDRITILGLDQIHKGELIIDGGTENDILDASRSPHAVTLLGGEGNDSLIGSAFNDSLGGGIGNDNLKGGAGDDKLTGDAGRDRLDGQAGKDCFVESVVGNARMTATALIASNVGTDVLISIECVEIFGDSNANLLDASLYKMGSVTLHGMGGNDTLLGGSAADVLDGGEGVDQVTQSSTKTQTLTDLLLTGNGSDTLMSIERANLTAKSALGNTLDASLFHGLVTLTGGSGPDRLLSSILGGKIIGGAGKDTIIGGDGNDIISGGNGNDWITGGIGHDAISGGDGDDWLDGQGGDDTVLGDAGHDIIQGGNGLDVCLGGAGNDNIDGGADRDTVSGGSGTNVITNAEVIDNLFTFDFNKLLV